MNFPARDQNILGNLAFNQNPSQFDRHLVTRSSPVVCGNNRPGISDDYDLPLHVVALVIILFVSTSACVFPLFIVKFPRIRIPRVFLFLVRHFGTGVIVATAFVHLLPTAFISLTDPCLGTFWNEDYPAMAGAIALAALLLITIIEMVFSPGNSSCAAYSVRGDDSHQLGDIEGAPGLSSGGKTNHTEPTRSAESPMDSQTNYLGGANNLHGRSSSTGRGLQRMTEENNSLSQTVHDESGNHPLQGEAQRESLERNHADNFMRPPLTESQQHKKALLQCILLEVGILFHSVFIGMALSVAVGNDFIVLLIAISFHQMFEGLALGSRIAALTWRPGAIQPWLMAFTYGCTTPIGQAIGLATRSLYDPDSQTGLLLVGTMNAISSGLLIFASVVDLLSEDFLSDESWRILRGRRRIGACFLVFLGAFGMSLIGAWA